MIWFVSDRASANAFRSGVPRVADDADAPVACCGGALVGSESSRSDSSDDSARWSFGDSSGPGPGSGTDRLVGETVAAGTSGGATCATGIRLPATAAKDTSGDTARFLGDELCAWALCVVQRAHLPMIMASFRQKKDVPPCSTWIWVPVDLRPVCVGLRSLTTAHEHLGERRRDNGRCTMQPTDMLAAACPACASTVCVLLLVTATHTHKWTGAQMSV